MLWRQHGPLADSPVAATPEERQATGFEPVVLPEDVLREGLGLSGDGEVHRARPSSRSSPRGPEQRTKAEAGHAGGHEESWDVDSANHGPHAVEAGGGPAPLWVQAGFRSLQEAFESGLWSASDEAFRGLAGFVEALPPFPETEPSAVDSAHAGNTPGHAALAVLGGLSGPPLERIAEFLDEHGPSGQAACGPAAGVPA